MKLNIDVEQAVISEQVVAAFAAIPEVQAIYMAPDDGIFRFWVFSNETVYDDALMSRLIDQELALSSLHPNVHLIFYFTPLMLCPDPQEIVPGRAMTVYQRLDG